MFTRRSERPSTRSDPSSCITPRSPVRTTGSSPSTEKRVPAAGCSTPRYPADMNSPPVAISPSVPGGNSAPESSTMRTSTPSRGSPESSGRAIASASPSWIPFWVTMPLVSVKPYAERSQVAGSQVFTASATSLGSMGSPVRRMTRKLFPSKAPDPARRLNVEGLECQTVAALVRTCSDSAAGLLTPGSKRCNSARENRAANVAEAAAAVQGGEARAKRWSAPRACSPAAGRPAKYCPTR